MDQLANASDFKMYIQSKSFENTLDRRSKVMNTEYSLEDMKQFVRGLVEQPIAVREFGYPPENHFIPTDLSVLEQGEPKDPKEIKKNHWHLKDN